jgi:HEAT repeat protein
LLAALSDKSALVRRAAARAIAWREEGEHFPIEPLLAGLDDNDVLVRALVVRALGQAGIRAPKELLVAALGSSEEVVREAAAEALKRTHPDALFAVIPEVLAIVNGQGAGSVFGSLVQGFIAETIGNLGFASSNLLEQLTLLLDWPYWEVRMKAAQALGKLRRNIPDAAIRRLLELRRDPQSRTVCVVANDALAEILSLETGIEDD